MAKAGNPKGYDGEEIDILSRGYAQIEIRKQKRHLKAFLKGKSHYTMYGRKYPVMTPELAAEQENTKEEEE